MHLCFMIVFIYIYLFYISSLLYPLNMLSFFKNILKFQYLHLLTRKICLKYFKSLILHLLIVIILNHLFLILNLLFLLVFLIFILFLKFQKFHHDLYFLLYHFTKKYRFHFISLLKLIIIFIR